MVHLNVINCVIIIVVSPEFLPVDNTSVSVEVVNTTSSSINLRWYQPLVATNMSKFYGYQVRYHQTSGAQTPIVRNVPYLPGSASNIQAFGNLQPYTQYSFEVQPYKDWDGSYREFDTSYPVKLRASTSCPGKKCMMKMFNSRWVASPHQMVYIIVLNKNTHFGYVAYIAIEFSNKHCFVCFKIQDTIYVFPIPFFVHIDHIHYDFVKYSPLYHILPFLYSVISSTCTKL